MMSLLRRARAWLRRQRPEPPPDITNAPEINERVRQNAFWTSELVLDQLQDLRCAAEGIRHRPPRREEEGR